MVEQFASCGERGIGGSESGEKSNGGEDEKKCQALRSHVGKVGDGGYLYFFHESDSRGGA